jgi:predicted Zn-dependent peptidase
VTEVVEAVHSAAVDLWVSVGSAYETELNNGVSHCIEHMLFKGTTSRSAERIAEEIEDAGGNIGASTARDFTKVYTRVLGEALPTALDIMTDMVANPTFDRADLKLEKQVILEEMEMYEDDAADLAQEIAYANHWRGYAHSYPITGTSESVKGLNETMLREHFDRYYRPERMVISVAGKFDEDEVITFLSERLGALKPGSEKKIPSSPECRRFNVLKNKDVEQAQMILVSEGMVEQDSRIILTDALELCLASSASSRLFKEIRERRGLVYDVGSGHHAYSTCGMMTVYASMNPANTDTVLKLILEELARVKAEGFTEAEINRAKKQLRADIFMGLDSMTARSSNNASDIHLWDKIVPLSEWEQKIADVNNKDMTALANELFNDDRLSLVVVGPAAELQEKYSLTVGKN